MKKLDPVDHITRPPLRWRTEPHLTECGMLLEGLAGRLITFPELQARINKVGQQRAAFSTCMTCWETGRRHFEALTDPIRVIARECVALEWVNLSGPPRLEEPATPRQVAAQRERNRKTRLALELDAIAALVAAHRPEFDEYIAGRAETVSLAERRTSRRRPSPNYRSTL